MMVFPEIEAFILIKTHLQKICYAKALEEIFVRRKAHGEVLNQSQRLVKLDSKH